jgi:AcrR family transcriptional regulator
MPAAASTRRDKARNRDRLVAAAVDVFARVGPDAPLDEIAQAAGVSRTTLHRHFTSRADLAATVFAANVAAIESRAEELRDEADGLAQLYHFVLDMQLAIPALARALSPSQAGELRALSERAAAAFELLVARDLPGTVLRVDMGVREILLTLPMAAAAMIEDAAAGRKPSPQVRALLHRGLFVTEPPETPSP